MMMVPMAMTMNLDAYCLFVWWRCVFGHVVCCQKELTLATHAASPCASLRTRTHAHSHTWSLGILPSRAHSGHDAP